MTAAISSMFDPVTDAERRAAPKPDACPPEPKPIVPVPDGAPPCSFRHLKRGVADRHWRYETAEGALVGHVARWDNLGADGTAKKLVIPWSYCDLGDGHCAWRMKGFSAPRPLYRLPDLARQPDATALIVEGEPAADAAAELFPDLVATTPPHGARSPDKADWSPLAGRRVVIWPDHDLPGLEFAKDVAKLAAESGAEVSIVQVPDAFPEKWDLADDLPEGSSNPDLRQLIDDALEARHEPRPEDGVCCPFRLTEEAVEVSKETKDGAFEWVPVCSRLEVLAVTRSATGEDWGRLLRLQDRDGTEHLWSMPMELLGGDGTEYRKRLLSLGLELSSGKTPRDQLHAYLTTCRPQARVRCVSRIGWHGRIFVLPDETFGECMAERVILQTPGTIDHAFRASGTLEDWQEQVARCAVGNSRLAFAVSAGFAAALLGPAGFESVGFHLRGASSTGKTTALHVAGSVWGGGDLKGYVRQWRATDNGLEGVALAHCDALLCLDELSQIDPRAAGASSYMLSNGMGKNRAGRGGEGRPPAKWRVLFLSTGEIDLATKVAEDGRRRVTAGQQVRVVDIPADAGAGLGLFEKLHGAENADRFSRQIREASTRYYGTAARAFLSGLIADLDTAVEATLGYRDSFVERYCPAGADGQVRRVAQHFALVAAAGEQARIMGVLPWEAGEVTRAARACFEAWLEQRGGIEPAEITAGIAQVRQFIEQHGDSRFVTQSDEESGRIVHQRAGFKKRNDQSSAIDSEDPTFDYYVTTGVWRSEVCRGYETKMLNRALIERGLLIPEQGSNRPDSKHRGPGEFSGGVRCIRLSGRILEG